MEEFWIPLLTILTLLTQTARASNTTELIGAVGGSVTFHSPKTEGNGALWSFGNEAIVSVVFEDPSQPVFLKEEYKTRFTVSEDGRALIISPLRMEDAGIYSVKINGKKSTFILRVYRELTEPTVTCEAQDCLDKICLFSLRCSVPGAGFGNISYNWTGRGHLWDKGSLVVLAVNKSSREELDPLTCTAWNAVSSRNVTVTTPEGLCPGTLSSSGVGIGLTVGVAVVVVILLVFLVFHCKSQGYGPASVARLVSELVKGSATARLGHQGYHQATSCLGPEPGPASDQHRPEPGPALDQHGPEPGLASDQFRPGLGQTSSVPEQITDRLRPELGLARDQHDQSLDRPRTSSLRSRNRYRTSLYQSQNSSLQNLEGSQTSADQNQD